MKERTFVTGLVGFLIIGTAIFSGSTDAIYVVVSIAFFLICLAYAEWCERL